MTNALQKRKTDNNCTKAEENGPKLRLNRGKQTKIVLNKRKTNDNCAKAEENG